jgi:S-adenosylmethionine:tRNA ribosyltransferase-isomerase
VRLLGPAEEGTWTAAVLGAGNWRWRTEDRPAPPPLPVGSTLTFGATNGDSEPMRATVVTISEVSPRLVRLAFDRQGDALWSAVYRRGRPVQYSYVRAPLALWHVQTAYASRPWAAEAPSAGRPLTWRVLLEARRRGIALAAVTHAAGLSSTGEPALDAALPLPERFDIPADTVAAVKRARAARGRIVAVGTTVVRALEGAAAAGAGRLVAGEGSTSLRVDRHFRPQVVDGLLTGIHQPGESHFDLLQAFAPEPLLRRALAHAEGEGYLAHEFGDSCLILPRAL